MQKFILPTKIRTQHDNNAPSVAAKVHMSGYLKKKRNKVGGWRKMWFVLQNQLLLSYTSKEEYDNKLVSFKDAVNLVPGTVVRPIGAVRFAIQTLTNIFTFRCSDSKNCTDWITALMESLSIQGQCAKENSLRVLVKCHTSLDNIRKPKCKKSIRASYSLDSFCPAKICKSPKLPIANSTARILERNGLTKADLIKIFQQRQESKNNKRTWNFRLHEKNPLMDQSHEVCRINKMFQRDNEKQFKFTEILSDKCSTDIEQFNRIPKNDCGLKNFKLKRTINQKVCSLEDQLHRLNLENTKKFETKPFTSKENSSKTKKPICDTEVCYKLSASVDNVTKAEPIYAVVDLKNKYARRAKLQELEAEMERERPKSIHVISSDYEEVLNFSNEYLDGDEDENENIYEPINIPDGTNHKNARWRYFPKINIDALIEMAKNRKKESKGDIQSSFQDIRKKLGNHRRSIKIRVRKFCTKKHPTTIKESIAFSDDELDSQGAAGSTSGASENSTKSSNENQKSCFNVPQVFEDISKIRRNEKNNLFGSLTRLRKTRTSLCLDDDNSKMKLIESQKIENINSGLQHQIDKQIKEKQTLCHSKFYD